MATCALRLNLMLLVIAVASCGPKVNVSPFDEDDPRAGGPRQSVAKPDAAVADPALPDIPTAPPGKKERTGTIDRSRLFAVLDAGPGAFLRGFEVASSLDARQRFVGWRLVQILDDASPLTSVDIETGDVLVSVLGMPVSRPDQLMAVWEALRTADALVCDVRRGGARVELRFSIVPPVGRVPPASGPETPAAPAPAPPAPPAPAPTR